MTATTSPGSPTAHRPLPETFVQAHSCSDHQIGRTHDVVRVPHADGSVSVYLDPETSRGRLLARAIAVPVCIFGALFVLFSLIVLGQRQAERRRS